MAAEPRGVRVEYMGRVFDVRATYREGTDGAWLAEITEVDETGQAVGVVGPKFPAPDPHAAMAAAVQAITRGVENGEV